MTKIIGQQDYYVESLNTEHGLSQGTIFDILQDKEGFLWIGTKDGLNRYDGHTFKVFTNDVKDPWSISGNHINLLFEDSAGRIWAATENEGINIYDKKSGRFHHIFNIPNDPTSLSGNTITSIVEDTSGYFIVAIAKNDLNMFQLDNTFFNESQPPNVIRLNISSISLNKSTNESVIRGLEKDSKGRIWVGSEKGTYQLDVQKPKFTLIMDDYLIGTMCPDKLGGIWSCGANNALAYFDGRKAIKLFDYLIPATDLKFDKNNNLWASTFNKVYAISLKDWQKDILPNTTEKRILFSWMPPKTDGDFAVKSLHVDRSGIVWVGGNGKGLYKINPNKNLFNLRLKGTSIWQIVPITNERLVAFSYNFDWFNQNEEKFDFASISANPEIKHDFMLVSKNGTFFIREPIRGEFRLRSFDPITKKTKSIPISWHHNEVQPMIETKDGMILMAGYSEVLAITDPNTGLTSSFNLSNGSRMSESNVQKEFLSSEYSEALYEDEAGAIWVGSGKGISKCLRPTTQNGGMMVTKYQNNKDDAQSLNYNNVTAFLDDPYQPKKYLWVCTRGGGLNRLDKSTGQFTHLTKKDGLPDNVVYAILTDSENNIWGSTNKGLFCLKQVINKDESISFHFRNFSKADGLQDDEFNSGSCAKFPDGKLAFGGINGYNIFNPKDVLSYNYEAPIFITNILVNNQQISPNDESKILITTAETSKSITLNHYQDILTLEFASLDFNAPNKNNFRYQLIGAQESWVELGNQRSVTFVKLPADKYIFRLQGSNSQGIWNENITELEINILPPWWKTWWAYLTYIFIALTGVWAYFQFSLNRSKLQQELAFEKREADRVRDLDLQKSQLYINMTHEFRTPLTIILGIAQQIGDNPKGNVKEGVNMIVRNGQNLLNLINKMLNLSKLESGKMILDMEEGDIVHFIRIIVESFRSYASNKEILLHFLPEIDELYISFDKDKVEQVLSNIISNAYKFTPQKGHIYISIKKIEDEITISIKDTGRGISSDDVERVFDRFYQVDNSTTRHYEGTGIGLALSKELVKLMNGTLSAQSPPVGARIGAEFILTLPILEVANNLERPGPPQDADLVSTLEKSSTTPKYYEHQGETIDIENREHASEDNTPLILLVEDNMDVLKYTASCLTDYRLIVAHNGQEGFEQAIEFIPDLIISDVMMPIMDGFEFCQKVKLDQRTNHIPVIILTARADFESKLEGLGIGANAYLPKPFEKKELLLNIKNILDLRNSLKHYYQLKLNLNDTKEAKTESAHETVPEDEFVLKIRELIELNLSNSDLNVEMLAKFVFLSHSQLGRKLDALTGLSPNKFIRYIRLNKAKEYLSNEEMSITAIAFDCGFNDPSYFSRLFKSETGLSPMEWREQKS